MKENQKIIFSREYQQKDFILFILISFLIPWLMAVPIYLCKKRGLDPSGFAIFQMYTPAFAVIILLFRNKNIKDILPKMFFYLFLLAFVLELVFRISFFVNKDIIAYYSIIYLILNILCLLILAKEDIRKKIIFNLDLKNLKLIIFISLVFLVLTIVRAFIALFLSHSFQEFLPTLNNPKTIIGFFSVYFGIFFSILPFWGEEFGWRFYLQPLLQKKLGMLKGVFLTGFIWGLWHLPLNILFYSDGKTWLVSLLIQIVVCMTMGIFFAYAYTKTQCIWSVVFLHFLNNNWIYVLSGSNPNAISGNTFQWNSLLQTIISGIVVFGGFALSKYLRDKNLRIPTMYERIEISKKE